MWASLFGDKIFTQHVHIQLVKKQSQVRTFRLFQWKWRYEILNGSARMSKISVITTWNTLPVLLKIALACFLRWFMPGWWYWASQAKWYHLRQVVMLSLNMLYLHNHNETLKKACYCYTYTFLKIFQIINRNWLKWPVCKLSLPSIRTQVEKELVFPYMEITTTTSIWKSIRTFRVLNDAKCFDRTHIIIHSLW